MGSDLTNNKGVKVATALSAMLLAILLIILANFNTKLHEHKLKYAHAVFLVYLSSFGGLSKMKNDQIVFEKQKHRS